MKSTSGRTAAMALTATCCLLAINTAAHAEVANAWKHRGGVLVGYEAHGSVMGMLMPTIHYPTGCGGEFHDNSERPKAVGGGAGGRLSLMNFTPPSEGGGSWIALRASTGVEFVGMALFLPVPQDYYYCIGSYTETRTAYVAQVPLALGGHLGLGGIGDAASWNGVVLGAAYAPTLSYIAGSGFDAQTKLNLVGLELSLDFTTLRALLERYAPEPHLRINVLLLPALREKDPWFATIGVGAVWY